MSSNDEVQDLVLEEGSGVSATVAETTGGHRGSGHGRGRGDSASGGSGHKDGRGRDCGGKRTKGDDADNGDGDGVGNDGKPMENSKKGLNGGSVNYDDGAVTCRACKQACPEEDFTGNSDDLSDPAASSLTPALAFSSRKTRCNQSLRLRYLISKAIAQTSHSEA